jgi:hypothetical protein
MLKESEMSFTRSSVFVVAAAEKNTIAVILLIALTGCAPKNLFYGDANLPCEARKTELERRQCRLTNSNDQLNTALQQEKSRRNEQRARH